MAAAERERTKRSRTWLERLELVRERGLEPVLIETAARWYTTPRHVLSQHRQRSAVLARHSFCRTLYAEPYRLSSTEVGELVGLDHSSVLSALGTLARKRSA